jgi:CRISPR-associated protein Csx10
MIALKYRIKLEEPLLATALSGEPNSAVAYPFIPGSLIRGLVAGRCRSARPDDDLTAWARYLIFDEQTRYLNAYPAAGLGRRRLPAPLSWRKEKTRTAEAGPIEDHALMSPDASDFETPKEVEGFVWQEDGTVTLYTAKRQITVHTLRDRLAGRPTGDLSTIYRYDALASDEVFEGTIIVPTVQAAHEIMACVPTGDYRLGGAATAGYGHVYLEYHEPAIDTDWQESDALPAKIAAGETFIVTLVSDAILRDDRGETHTDLERALGFPAVQVQAFKKVAPVGGFNRTWGMPLPQELALRTGSVFVLRATAPITAAAVESLLGEGIGERRSEGFGRLVVNWQSEKTLTQEKLGTPHPQQRGPALTGDAKTMAQQMALRRLRRELDQALVKMINHPQLKVSRAPANNQLARVRVIARSALAQNNLVRIGDLFKPTKPTADDPEAKKPAAIKSHALKRFEAARVGGQRMSEWIAELADQPENVWLLLGVEPQGKPLGKALPKSGGLAEEYAVRLIDGVLGRAAAERRRGGRTDDSTS